MKEAPRVPFVSGKRPAGLWFVRALCSIVVGVGIGRDPCWNLCHEAGHILRCLSLRVVHGGYLGWLVKLSWSSVVLSSQSSCVLKSVGRCSSMILLLMKRCQS